MASVDEPVELCKHDPRWLQRYEEEARSLTAQLGPRLVGIEHIGSTAVPGLLAKPIVDLMLGVADLDQSQPLVDALVLAGYEDCGAVPGRRYLRKRGGLHFNAQVVEHRGRLWRDNLLLRAYLRAHPEAVRAYADAKLVAAEAAPMLLAYSKRKSEAIERLLEAARL